MRTKLLASAICVAALTVGRANAQELPMALTGAALSAEVTSVLNGLNDLGTSWSGDAMIATNNAATQVSAALDQFRTLLHDQWNVPLVSLSSDVRNAASVLYGSTKNLKNLIDRQRQCLFGQIDLFLAAIETTAANLKSGVPFVGSSGPRLVSFQFEGHATKNLTPSAGGRMTLSGFDLWPAVAPKASILSMDRGTTLLKMKPTKGASKDEISLVVPETLLSAHTGECLQLRIETFREKKLAFISTGTEQTAELYYPLCVPRDYGAKVNLDVSLQYDVAKASERPLEPWQNFRFDNVTCNHRAPVSATKGWSLPSGFSILRVETRKSELRNDDNNINWSFAGATITAAGEQASPTCAKFKIPPFGPTIERMFHSAIWSFDAQPVITGTIYETRSASASATDVAMTPPETRICTLVEKTADEPGRESTAWFNLTPVVRDKPAALTFKSTRLSTVNTGHWGPDDFGGYVVSAVYNPTPVDGKAELCVTLQSKSACGY
jgi:hypothetical protein